MSVAESSRPAVMTAFNPQPTLAVVLCASLQAIGGGLGWSVVPPMLPKISAELGLSSTMAGVVWGAAPLGIALAAPIGGSLVDRLGPRRVAGLAMLLGAVSCAARAFVGDGIQLLLAMFVFGLHVGLVAPAIPKALAAHVPVARLARANGTALLSYTLATAITVLTARSVLEPLFGGWRGLMLGVSGALAAVGITWFWLMRDQPQTAAGHARLSDVLKLGAHPGLRRVAAMQFLLFGGYLAMLGMLPKTLLKAGVAPAQVATAVAAWLFAAALANQVGPMVSEKLGRARPVLVVGSIVAGVSLLTLSALSTQWALPLLVIAALGGGSFAPLLVTLPLQLEGVGVAKAGAAIGLLMMVGQIGGATLPVLAGRADELGGFSAQMFLLGLVHLAILIPALTLRESSSARS